MKLGMSCYCLDPAMASGQMSVDDVVDYAVAHGCEHIEFVPFRLAFVTPERTLDWELIDHVREKCKSAGIEISTYSVNADLLKTDPEEEEREIERVKRHIDAAQGLGLSRMRFDVASFRRPFSTNTIYDFNREFPQMVKNGTILCDYAAEKGIPVANVPTYGTASVSQFSIALLLEVCHHIGHHDASVHAGNWANCIDWCYWDYPLIELEGKTIGVIGFGRIGQTEGRIAKAMGMKVLAYDLYPNDSGREIAEYVDLDTLYAQADVITLHCNLTPENTCMINKDSIAKMKDGVILINNARGQLINEQDVADALNSGKMGAAGLDVVYTEPIRANNPLLQAKNCIITPHISWAPKESRQRIMDCAVSNVKAYLDGKPVNVVNLK